MAVQSRQLREASKTAESEAFIFEDLDLLSLRSIKSYGRACPPINSLHSIIHFSSSTMKKVLSPSEIIRPDGFFGNGAIDPLPTLQQLKNILLTTSIVIQTFLPQQVPTAHTLPNPQPALLPQSKTTAMGLSVNTESCAISGARADASAARSTCTERIAVT